MILPAGTITDYSSLVIMGNVLTHWLLWGMFFLTGRHGECSFSLVVMGNITTHWLSWGMLLINGCHWECSSHELLTDKCYLDMRCDIDVMRYDMI